MPNWSFILNHEGENRKEYFNAVAPPIIQSSNFAFDTLDDFRNALTDQMGNYVYSRGMNPTVDILRKKVAALENTEEALVFASGSGAIAMAILSQVQAGDHLICIESPYSWTKRLITEFLPRFGVSHTFVDGKDVEKIKWAIQPNTKLIFLESPNSLTYELQDLKAVAALAKANQLTTCIDNSYASPIFQRPHELGIDLVAHSATKYLNGHSDVMAGVICGAKEKMHHIFDQQQMMLGNVISPNDAAMMIRGLRTLELRMHRCNESGLKIAQYLENHAKVKQVLHPGLPSFPQYELAQQQMSGYGGLFSIYLNVDSIQQVEIFFNRLQRFLFAVSWGGYESLVLPAAAFHQVPGMPPSPVPWNLVRLYIGFEDPNWLIEDLEQALDGI